MHGFQSRHQRMLQQVHWAIHLIFSMLNWDRCCSMQVVRHASTKEPKNAAAQSVTKIAYEEALKLIELDKKERLEMLGRVEKEIARVKKGTHFLYDLKKQQESHTFCNSWITNKRCAAGCIGIAKVWSAGQVWTERSRNSAKLQAWYW